MAEVGNYPLWWPQVRAVARIDDISARVVIRSFLPYRLECVATSDVQDRAAGRLVARLSGAIEGTSSWTLSQEGVHTVMHYAQDVDTPHWPLRAARTFRWLPEMNHAWMMRSGERGLRRRFAAMTR